MLARIVSKHRKRQPRRAGLRLADVASELPVCPGCRGGAATRESVPALASASDLWRCAAVGRGKTISREPSAYRWCRADPIGGGEIGARESQLGLGFVPVHDFQEAWKRQNGRLVAAGWQNHAQDPGAYQLSQNPVSRRSRNPRAVREVSATENGLAEDPIESLDSVSGSRH